MNAYKQKCVPCTISSWSSGNVWSRDRIVVRERIGLEFTVLAQSRPKIGQMRFQMWPWFGPWFGLKQKKKTQLPVLPSNKLELKSFQKTHRVEIKARAGLKRTSFFLTVVNMRVLGKKYVLKFGFQLDFFCPRLSQLLRHNCRQNMRTNKDNSLGGFPKIPTLPQPFHKSVLLISLLSIGVLIALLSHHFFYGIKADMFSTWNEPSGWESVAHRCLCVQKTKTAGQPCDTCFLRWSRGGLSLWRLCWTWLEPKIWQTT